MARFDKVPQQELVNVVKANLGAFLPADTPAWITAAAGTFSVFNIWTVVLLIIGFGAACKVPRDNLLRSWCRGLMDRRQGRNRGHIRLRPVKKSDRSVFFASGLEGEYEENLLVAVGAILVLALGIRGRA